MSRVSFQISHFLLQPLDLWNLNLLSIIASSLVTPLRNVLNFFKWDESQGITCVYIVPKFRSDMAEFLIGRIRGLSACSLLLGVEEPSIPVTPYGLKMWFHRTSGCIFLKTSPGAGILARYESNFYNEPNYSRTCKINILCLNEGLLQKNKVNKYISRHGVDTKSWTNWSFQDSEPFGIFPLYIWGSKPFSVFYLNLQVSKPFGFGFIQFRGRLYPTINWQHG